MLNGIKAGTKQVALFLDLYTNAFKDVLTKLPNRKNFIHSLNSPDYSKTMDGLNVLLIDLRDFSDVNDSLGQDTQEEFDNSFEGSRFAFQIGANYHVPDLEGDNLDLYFGFAIGTNNINATLEKEQNDLNDAAVRSQNYFLNSGFFFNSASLAQTPLSARFRVGGRYFFKTNLALNAELGTGIRTLSVGLTFKL